MKSLTELLNEKLIISKNNTPRYGKIDKEKWRSIEDTFVEWTDPASHRDRNIKKMLNTADGLRKFVTDNIYDFKDYYKENTLSGDELTDDEIDILSDPANNTKQSFSYLVEEIIRVNKVI